MRSVRTEVKKFDQLSTPHPIYPSILLPSNEYTTEIIRVTKTGARRRVGKFKVHSGVYEEATPYLYSIIGLLVAFTGDSGLIAKRSLPFSYL